MNLENAPRSLTYVNLDGNQITNMNWKKAPRSLTRVFLGRNQITNMNWVNAPSSLTGVDLGGNQITNMNWENAPRPLTKVFPYTKEYKQYLSARSIQRVYLKHYTRRKVAACKIANLAMNWVWKPMCKDGTMGIRPRLDTQALGLDYLN